MRRLALACSLTCLACVRLNPAFDEARASESGSETRGDTSDPSDDGTDESSDTDATSDTGLDDLPGQPVCELQPSDGLALVFGDPADIGGLCPNGVNAWAKISSAAGGEAMLTVCDDDSCEGCDGEHPLSAFPLIVTEHLPQVGSCVLVQASTLLAEQPSSCLWGAISVHGPLNGAPYVIATAHSAPPTPYGADILAGVIPEPMKGSNCNCDDIGQGNECCYQAEGPPEFYYYPFANGDVHPGEFISVQITNQATADYYFELFQAQRINSCEAPDLQLSWAVVAKF